MSHEPDAEDPGGVTDPSTRSTAAKGVAIALMGAIALGVAVLGWAWARPDVPSDTSADVGFARAMQAHHAQAVEMAFLIRDRTEDPAIKTLAFDIITGQQQQIGQMYGWLEMWQLPQVATAWSMSWMEGAGEHPQAMDAMSEENPATQMPGMASEAEMRSLEDAKSPEAEVLFLRLMIAHHQGGVAMARSALERAQEPTVIQLAGAIEASQTVEIDQMRQLLRDREGRRAP